MTAQNAIISFFECKKAGQTASPAEGVTGKIGSITVNVILGDKDHMAKDVVYPVDWTQTLSEVRREIPGQMTKALLAGVDAITIPVSWANSCAQGSSPELTSLVILDSIEVANQRANGKPFMLTLFTPVQKEQPTSNTIANDLAHYQFVTRFMSRVCELAKRNAPKP